MNRSRYLTEKRQPIVWPKIHVGQRWRLKDNKDHVRTIVGQISPRRWLANIENVNFKLEVNEKTLLEKYEQI